MRLVIPGKRTPFPEFRYPIEPAPRVLLLGNGFRQSPATKVLPVETCLDLRLVTEDTLAAPVWRLRELAAQRTAMRYPLVAFTGTLHGEITPGDRDLFWRTFGVPVFEQLLDASGKVLAEECEAHSALHVRSPSPSATPAKCACGRLGVLLARPNRGRAACA